MFKEKLKYYIFGYILGWVISTVNTGVPNIYYLSPIKIIAISIAILVGNALYFGIEKKLNIFTGTIHSFKYIAFSLVLLIVFCFLKSILVRNGIDISPFIGFTKA